MIWNTCKNFVGDVIDKIMTSQPLFENTLILRRPGVVIFAEIIIVTMIVRTITKDSKKVKINL